MLFSASGIVVNQINILRPFVTIPDILAAAKLLKALNPEHVVPGHGIPGTVKIFEDTEQYYALLLDRVDRLQDAIATRRKSRGWRLRDRIGERVQWWQDVDEREATY